MAPSHRSKAEILISIGKELQTEVTDASSVSLQRIAEHIAALREATTSNNTKATTTMTIALLQETKIGATLSKSIKAFRRHKRTDASDHSSAWTELMEDSQALLKEWKQAADVDNEERKKRHVDGSDECDTEQSLPRTTSIYRARLTKHGKDMYKDPPALPPASIVVEEVRCSLPKRNTSTGLLSFLASKDSDIASQLKDFHPNRTPEEVLRAGSFGGTYFRPITSAVMNKRYTAAEVLQDTVPPNWIDGLDKKTMLTSTTYRPQINKYGVKCGGSLGMWESSGWIADSDPYGWFQWYCRFYQGRRCSDDSRQISRWLKSAGPKGRFRSQLCNKILAANARHDNASISPVIRQTLLHWGLEITPTVLEQHRKRVK